MPKFLSITEGRGVSEVGGGDVTDYDIPYRWKQLFVIEGSSITRHR